VQQYSPVLDGFRLWAEGLLHDIFNLFPVSQNKIPCILKGANHLVFSANDWSIEPCSDKCAYEVPENRANSL